MARNEEKANTMLSRFLQMKKEESGKVKPKRPFLASKCRDLNEADKWRQQILREIGKKVMEIQNPGLGEHRIRDLNDEINKLIREKGHWEARIVELGGPNYRRTAPRVFGDDGSEIQTSGKGIGYKYFGAAKQLPGVRELFEAPAQPQKKRNRYELYKRIDADYYGYRDEEDGVLLKAEGKAGRLRREKAVAEWKTMKALKDEAKSKVKSGEVVSVEETADLDSIVAPLFLDDEAEDDGEQRDSRDGGLGEGSEWLERQFVAHVPLPDEKEIEKMILAKKKADLLSIYASESLVSDEKEAKELLNIKH